MYIYITVAVYHVAHLWFVGRLSVRSLFQNLHDRDLAESKLFTNDAHRVS